MLLYISAKCFSGQLFALHHLAGTDTLGNLVNGLGQINCNAFHTDSPNFSHHDAWYRRVVWGESITALKVAPCGRWERGKAAMRPLRVIMPLYNEEIYFVARADSPLAGLDLLATAVVVLDREGCATYLNPSAEQLFDSSPA